MGFRINLCLPLAGIIILSACQGQDQREPIQRGSKKNGKVQTMDSQCRFTNVERIFQKTRTIIKNDCLDLAMLVNCLKGADNEVARFTTTNLKVLEPATDQENLKPVPNRKNVLAQLLNQPGELKLKNISGRLGEIRPIIEELNAVTQTKCETVTFKDSTGDLIYTITSSSNRHLKMQLGTKSDWIVVTASNSGKVQIQRTRPLDANICGKARSLIIREHLDLTYGSFASKSSSISKELAQLLTDHTDASDNLKNSLKEPENKSGRAKLQGRSEMVEIDELALEDAYSRVSPGKLKNLECSN